jgi:NitT/TauT family transport system substrate-binding protein
MHVKSAARRRVVPGALAVAVAAVVAPGTAGATTEPPPTSEAAATDASVAPGEGCGPESVTDPADLSPDRAPARCAAGFPEPQPLAERQTVTLSTAFRAEFVAPILLADALGEFDAENIDVEIQELGFSDALPLMASGDVDIAVGGTEAAFFNAVNSGIEARWALSNFSPPDAGDTSIPQTGLWVRRDAFSDPANPDLAELADMTMASAVGNGSTIAYPIQAALEGAGLSLADVTVEQIPSDEMVTALENGAVQAAWLLDPYWIAISDNPDYALVATQPPGEPIGGLYFAPGFLADEHDAALAFTRAYIRTINTYLSGDYQADADVMAALSEATGTEVEALAATPALEFDWEIRSGTTDREQAVFIELETVDYDEPIAEDGVVDRSLYLEAVGAES